METRELFPIFDKLTDRERELISSNAYEKEFAPGEIIHDGSGSCLGLVLVRDGQLRAFIRSEDGREITVYRLFERDICLMAASCMMRSIMFDITISAEKACTVTVIPANIYAEIVLGSAPFANFVSEIMGERLSEVMWLIEQIMWKSLDRRLASFLIEESAIEGSESLSITHEKIASHLGSAREVVSRMLKYLSSEGILTLSRGEIRIDNMHALRELAK
jgi:CRP/FNR family transcriptional regulator